MDIIDHVIEKCDRRSESKAKRFPSRIPLRSEYDNCIYAWQCTHCGACWKVYHNPSHYEGCGPHLIDLRKLRKGMRVVHAEHGAGTITSMRRRREKSELQDGHVTVRFDKHGKTLMMPLRTKIVDSGREGWREISGALLAQVSH